MAAWDSIVATDAKAQQEPQCPWSLTGVTTPSSLQSTNVGRDATYSFVGISYVVEARLRKD